jgi:hypothetical protein
MLNFKPIKKEASVSCCSTQPQESGSGCCTPQPKGKAACPACGEMAKGVLAKTVEHLLNDDAKATLECFEGFHFCKTPECEVVYFREDTRFTQNDMRVVVGLKAGASPATVCYCFDWTKEKIRAELEVSGESTASADITQKMETVGCSCELLNPSGGCCLGDIAKAVKEAKKALGLE